MSSPSCRLATGRRCSEPRFAVSLHTAVRHPTVERREDVEGAGPVLGEERRLQGRDMRIAKADEPALGDVENATGFVTKSATPHEQSASDVELETMLEYLRGVTVEADAVLGSELQREPVRSVHQTLVLDVVILDVGAQAVEDAREVGPGIVDVVGVRLGRSAACRHVAVAEGAQALAQALLLGVVSLVGPHPGVHVGAPRRRADRGAGPAERGTARPRRDPAGDDARPCDGRPHRPRRRDLARAPLVTRPRPSRRHRRTRPRRRRPRVRPAAGSNATPDPCPMGCRGATRRSSSRPPSATRRGGRRRYARLPRDAEWPRRASGDSARRSRTSCVRPTPPARRRRPSATPSRRR